jgi:hypothetical protein
MGSGAEPQGQISDSSVSLTGGAKARVHDGSREGEQDKSERERRREKDRERGREREEYLLHHSPTTSPVFHPRQHSTCGCPARGTAGPNISVGAGARRVWGGWGEVSLRAGRLGRGEATQGLEDVDGEFEEGGLRDRIKMTCLAAVSS